MFAEKLVDALQFNEVKTFCFEMCSLDNRVIRKYDM
ncbi:MAG: hypothetical protein Homavirus35_6, partial [Homavirus sp.]